MCYSSQVKLISYLKANAAAVLMRLAEQREPIIITQNGEARAVLPDVAAGKVISVADVVAQVRAKLSSSLTASSTVSQSIYLIADGHRHMQTALARRLRGA